jgi:hypothetical protein
LAACSSGSRTTTTERKSRGVISVVLKEVPSGVHCLEVNVMSSDKSVTLQTHRFPANPGQEAQLTDLPLEWVLISEKAYDVSCDDVTSSTPISWYSPTSTSVHLINGDPISVTIVLHPATGPGGVSVTTDFQPAPTTCEGWVCSPWNYGTGNGCDCNCGCWDPDCEAAQASDGGAGGVGDAGLNSSVILGCSNWQTCVQPGVCQNVACVGWTCPRSWYGDGVCQTWCGCPDSDCPSEDGGTGDGAPQPNPDADHDAGAPTCSTCAWGHTFESNNGGFTVSGGPTNWAHGVSARPAHSGTNVWATNLSGNYRANEDGYLISQVIDLSAYTGRRITMSWYQEVHLGMGANGYVEVSKDGGTTWKNIDQVGGRYGQDSGWYRTVIELDSSYAVSNFRFLFHFAAGAYGGNEGWGWYIDDVCLAPGILDAYAYKTDFEQNGAGFTNSGNFDWVYGTPVNGPGNAHSGSRVWATNLVGSYAGSAEYVLTSPAIDLRTLSGESSIDLRWWSWLESETNYDWARLEVSADGSTWSEVWSSTSYPSWDQKAIKLNRSFATSNFHLRLRFTSDNVNNYKGWFVDDLSIQGTTLASCAPTGDTCVCTGGIDLNGNTVSRSCGESVCAADRHTWSCSVSGWSGPGDACGTTTCQCSGGIDLNGNTVSLNCGESVCAADRHTWSCNSGGWSGPGEACGSGPSCQCTGGLDMNGNAVTLSCGETVCGGDRHTWSCSASGWSGPGDACGAT